MKYSVSVFYNEERDEQGRHVAWCDGWDRSHSMKWVTSFPVEAEDPHHAAEKAWREMNRVDGTEHISTANIPERSMCVGDVVVVSYEGQDATWMAAASFGFDEIEPNIETMRFPIEKVEV